MSATHGFTTEVEHLDQTGIVRMSGRVDRIAAEALDTAFEQAARAGLVLLDFTAVDFINSTGIALIVGLLQRAEAGGVEMEACGLSDHFREIFEITRIVDYLPIRNGCGGELDPSNGEEQG